MSWREWRIWCVAFWILYPIALTVVGLIALLTLARDFIKSPSTSQRS
jgi:hypothetical protein